MRKSLPLFLLAAISAATLLLPGARAQPLPGQIVIDPEHPQWLKRHGGGHVFICGPGDPEGFLYPVRAGLMAHATAIRSR